MNTRTTESIIVGKDALSRIPSELSRLWPDRTPLVVADENTWAAAGSRVRDLIRSNSARCESYVFDAPRRLHADTERVAELARVLAESGPVVPVAVGSGTLNDIVKRAAGEAGLSYLCVPTAPSVDGYTSFGAAITVNGFKTTLPCEAPKAVVADEGVMAAAPYPLLAAGYGDLAAKLMSGRDWLLAEALGLETIDPSIWNLSQGSLANRLARPLLVRARDPGAVRDVFAGLCDTGLAMQDQGDSRPASGAEHHVSHVLEMRALSADGREALHGEKVAAGSLLSAAVAEYILSLDAAEISRFAETRDTTSPAAREGEVRRIYAGTIIPPFAVDAAVDASLAKLGDGAGLSSRLARVASEWEGLRTLLRRDRPSYDELAVMFSRVGCPSLPEIGLTQPLASWALYAAQTIRARYTILDLSWDLGLFENAVRYAVARAFKHARGDAL